MNKSSVDLWKKKKSFIERKDTVYVFIVICEYNTNSQKVGTGTGKDWESCEMLTKQLQHSKAKYVKW